MSASKMKSFFFSASGESNLAYLLLRVFFGFAFITHGYGKVFNRFGQFCGYIEKLNIPMPVISAALAAGSEFFGGVLLIIGLCTRISAFMIGSTMFIAAFVAHGGAPFVERELAFIYLFCAILFLFKGPGRYSVDSIIMKK